MAECTIGGLRVRYLDEGSGPVILLVHGWGAPAETYRLLIDHLKTSFRVIAPDLPGFGGSQEPAEPWTVPQYADWLQSFVTQLQLTELIPLGHSNGGRILLEWVTRGGLPVQIPKMILMDAAGLRPHRGPRYYGKVWSFKAVKHIMALPGLRSLFPHAVEKARTRFGSADYRTASPVMQRTLSLAVNTDLSGRLPLVPMPTLLLWGEKDTATPLSDGKRMEKSIPDAGLVVIPGAGHFAFAENIGLCRRVLDSFLK